MEKLGVYLINLSAMVCAIAVGTAVIWSTASFIAWDMYPGNWGWFLRALAAIPTLGWAGMIIDLASDEIANDLSNLETEKEDAS